MMDTSPTVTLVETHTRKERKNVAHSITEEPSVVLLEYRFRTDSVRCQNSIQAGFSGGRLETTVKQTDESITNLSDQIVMKIDTGDAIMIGNHLSIVTLPVAIATNGIVHQAFDLTHGVGSFELLLV